MTIPVKIADGQTGETVNVHTRNGDAGIVAFTDDLRQYDVQFLPAFNPLLGIEMARDFSFSGTPVGVHNGTDAVQWTGTAITGTKFTFDSTDQANSGTKSVKTNNAVVGNVMEFDKGSDIDLSNYVAITMFIYVSSNWSGLSADSIILYGWDTGTGLQIESSVRLEDYFNEVIFNTWHKVSIPLGDFNLQSSTIDAFRVEVSARSGAGPTFYIDDFQVEEASGAAKFNVVAPQQTIYLIQSISFSFVDALDTTLASNSMHNLSYDKILGLSELSAGIVFQRRRKGTVLFSAAVKSIGDSIKGGATLKNVISDGTNTCITLETDFISPALLDSREDDAIELILSDDLSGLISFTAIFKGKTRPV